MNSVNVIIYDLVIASIKGAKTSARNVNKVLSNFNIDFPVYMIILKWFAQLTGKYLFLNYLKRSNRDAY